MSVVDDSFNQPLQPEEHAVMSLAGGIMGQGYQCGMLWGAALLALLGSVWLCLYPNMGHPAGGERFQHDVLAFLKEAD